MKIYMSFYVNRPRLISKHSLNEGGCSFVYRICFCVKVDEYLRPTEPSFNIATTLDIHLEHWLNGLDINTMQDARQESNIGRRRRQKRMEHAVAQFHGHKPMSFLVHKKCRSAPRFAITVSREGGRNGCHHGHRPALCLAVQVDQGGEINCSWEGIRPVHISQYRSSKQSNNLESGGKHTKFTFRNSGKPRRLKKLLKTNTAPRFSETLNDCTSSVKKNFVRFLLVFT